MGVPIRVSYFGYRRELSVWDEQDSWFRYCHELDSLHLGTPIASIENEVVLFNSAIIEIIEISDLVELHVYLQLTQKECVVAKDNLQDFRDNLWQTLFNKSSSNMEVLNA